MRAFLVQEIQRHVGGGGDANDAGLPAHALFFDRPQNMKRARLHRPHDPPALADVAFGVAALKHARPATLTGQLHQAEAGDLARLHPRAIPLEAIPHAFFDGAGVFRLLHINEVDDDQPGQIAEAELPAGFLRRLEIGLQRGGFDIAFARGPTGVYVDRHKGFGLVDDQIAA